MRALWCHSSGRRRPRRLARNTLLPSQLLSPHFCVCAMRPTRTPPVRGSARSWISCRRGGRGGGGGGRGRGDSPPTLILDHISGSYLFCGPGGEGVWRLVSCTSAVAGAPDDGRASLKQLTLLASTLQPGTMSPQSLKFVLLAALQALSVCDGLVVSRTDEGKRKCLLWLSFSDPQPVLAPSFVHLCIIVLLLKYDVYICVHWFCVWNTEQQTAPWCRCDHHIREASAFQSSSKIRKCFVPAWITSLFQSITEVPLFVWSVSGRKTHLGVGVGGLSHLQQQLKDISWKGSVSDVMPEREVLHSGLGLITSQSPAFTPREEISKVHLHGAQEWRCPQDAVASKQSPRLLRKTGNEFQSPRKLSLFFYMSSFPHAHTPTRVPTEY